MKLWLLRFHRWVALSFALPLVFVLVTGLILSLEPWLVTASIVPDALNAETITEWLRERDPDNHARSIAHRSYDQTLTVSRRDADTLIIDTTSGEARRTPGALAELLANARRVHERLMFDLGWLVIASSVSMLVLALLGVLMGLPRLRNSLSGWHQALAWCLLPLVVASPLTGIFIAAGVTFVPRPAAGDAPPIRLTEAVRIVGAQHDLSTLVWLRPQGGRMLARLVEDGEYRVYAVTKDGLTVQPRNWPRLWHEGNFAGAWSSLLNVLTSIALIGLLVTGPWLWLSRRARSRLRQQQRTTGSDSTG